VVSNGVERGGKGQRGESTLEDGVDNPLLLSAAAPGGQVARHRLVDLDEAGLLVDDVELVLVNQLVVAGAQLTDSLVVLIHNGNMPMSMAIAGIVVAFKAEQHILALPPRRLEVGRPDAVDAIPGPDEVAVIPEDVRPRLARAVLRGGRVGEAGEGGHEQVARVGVLGGRVGDVEPRRGEVGAGAELPVGSGRAQQQVRCEERGDGPHGGGGGAARVELGASATASSIVCNDRYIHLW